MSPCALCGAPAQEAVQAEAAWAAPEVIERLAQAHPGWRRADGGCPACVQQALLEVLLSRGEAAYHESVQRAWPLDAEAAFGALPTPVRLHGDPRYRGRGVTIALVDGAFYPHADLTRPRNRIRAWVDAGRQDLRVLRFGPDDEPRWPGWDAGADAQWHGLMTSVVAAGNGALSHELYRGLASEAELALLPVRDASGHIGNAAIARALRWLERRGPDLGVRVVNLSLGGDPVEPLRGNAVDEAVAALVAKGITVVAAAGNDGVRRLVPPGTALDALTIGGLDDGNTLTHDEHALWRGNYGQTAQGVLKPELVAPSMWVAAPVLPGTPLAREAAHLFAARAGDEKAEAALAERKLVTPHYQHVDGTSFAAPLVASVVACMLEANPALTPRRIRELLVAAAHPVPGAPLERQGAGALDAGRAVSLALAEKAGQAFAGSPSPTADGWRFVLHDGQAREVRVLGSWDGWREPGLSAALANGRWEARLGALASGTYHYKFAVDGRWLADPANPARAHDGHGSLNSVLMA